ncbi:hemolysin family protein [Tessaracoccus sp. OS52]|uniref:hemolysin family protein n=1 Tax=Tessaracoccus sp. OS52 TaxID=2886691 RepID=UPI001D115E80|nr:hemolysin family protein [Tessaracoccus sp. OS52]
MTPSEWTTLAVALVCAIIASLLAAIETALSVISRGRAERMVDEGIPGAGRIREMAQDPAPSINAVMFTRMLLEISTIVLVALVVFDNVSGLWGRVGLTVGVMLLVSFIFWGVAPRTIGRQKPESVMRAFALMVSVLTTVLGPVAALMVLLGNALTPGRGFADGPFASEAELREYVDLAEANDLIEARESKMIHSVFELGDTLVKEVMVPRPDMVYIPADRTLRQLLSLSLRSGFSRIPVVGEGGIDDVLGVVYMKDVSKRIYDFPDAERTETVGEHMRPATFVPDSKPAGELLRDMQLRHSHLVIVIDEFGGTAGLCTMEDVVEEIVGEIVDEYDEEIPNVVELGEGRYRVSSRLPLDELGDLFHLEWDDEDVETVGGLMAKLLNVVPIPGSKVIFDGIEMVADRAVGRRHQVGTVLVRQLTAEELQPAHPEGDAEDDD